MARILVLADDEATRRLLTTYLIEDHHQVLQSDSVEQGLSFLADDNVDVVVADQNAGTDEHLSALACEGDAATSIIVLTADPTALTARVLRTAFFVAKPFHPDILRIAARRACERTQLLRENLMLKNAPACSQCRAEIHEGIFPKAVSDDGNQRTQPVATAAASFDLTAVLRRTEKELILRTLTETGGAQAEAARRMGLSRSALAYKLHKYGIRRTGQCIMREQPC